MTGGDYQNINTAPVVHGRIDQLLQVCFGLVGARDASTAKFFGKRFAFAGSQQNSDLKAICGQGPRYLRRCRIRPL